MNPYLREREKEREREIFFRDLDFWEKNAERGEEFIWVRVKEFEFIYYSSFVTKETYFDERVREYREREE